MPGQRTCVHHLQALPLCGHQPATNHLLPSTGAVQLRNELSSSFGVELPPTVTFDYPTPAALARFIAGQAAGSPLHTVPAPEALAPSAASPPTAPEASPAAQAAAPSTADVTTAVASIVATVLGAEVALDEPLMAAGLDSLGTHPHRNASLLVAIFITLRSTCIV